MRAPGCPSRATGSPRADRPRSATGESRVSPACIPGVEVCIEGFFPAVVVRDFVADQYVNHENASKSYASLPRYEILRANVNREMHARSVTHALTGRAEGCSQLQQVCAIRYTANTTPSRRTPCLPRLIIRSSDIHAAGCFTLEDIPKGTRVLEYTGERITKERGRRALRRPPVHLPVRSWRWRGGYRRPRNGHVREPLLRSQLRDRRGRRAASTSIRFAMSRPAKSSPTTTGSTTATTKRRATAAARLPRQHVLPGGAERRRRAPRPRKKKQALAAQGEAIFAPAGLIRLRIHLQTLQNPGNRYKLPRPSQCGCCRSRCSVRCRVPPLPSVPERLWPAKLPCTVSGKSDLMPPFTVEALTSAFGDAGSPSWMLPLTDLSLISRTLFRTCSWPRCRR